MSNQSDNKIIILKTLLHIMTVQCYWLTVYWFLLTLHSILCLYSLTLRLLNLSICLSYNLHHKHGTLIYLFIYLTGFYQNSCALVLLLQTVQQLKIVVVWFYYHNLDVQHCICNKFLLKSLI